MRYSCLLNLLLPAALFAQMSIHDIQFTTDPSGASPWAGQLVSVGGIVTATEYTGQPIRYFLSDRGGGPWSGILVNDNQLRQIIRGDSVRFQAEVQESNTQTRLRNIVAGTFTVVSVGAQVAPTPTTTGSVTEPMEGVLVEIANAVVVDDQPQITIDDGSGPVGVGTGWDYAVELLLGDSLLFLRGIVSSAANVFLVNPRATSDIGLLHNHGPVISQVANFPAEPTNHDSVTVTASVFDADGVAGVEVHYRFGPLGDFIPQSMFDDGAHGDGGSGDGNWGGIVPAGAAHVFAYYYVRAIDGLGTISTNPAAAPEESYHYRIRGDPPAIFDLQYTGDPTGGVSPYDGQFVTVIGIVTGTGFNNDFSFFMCDPVGIWPDSGRWSGIEVYAPDRMPSLWDSIRVTGQVIDYAGSLTEFASGSQVAVLGTSQPIPSLRVRAAELSPPNGSLPDSGEAYEGVLIEIGPSMVTNTSDFNSYGQFDVSGLEGSCTIVNDAGFEFVPVVGDSFLFIRGNCTYLPFAGYIGHVTAPRFDADLGFIDRRPPEILSATAVSDLSVNILFNERLSDVGANDPGNYTITDQSVPEHPRLDVASAAVLSAGHTVHLELLAALDSEHGYRLEIQAIEDLAGNELAGAVVFFGGYSPTAFVPIASLYDSFGVYSGQIVTLRGVVNYVREITTDSGSRRVAAYLQDQSGRGLYLTQSGRMNAYPALRRRNLITITGLVGSFNNEIQLGGFTSFGMTLINEGVSLPPPIVMTTGDRELQDSIGRTSFQNLHGSGTWCATTGAINRVDENIDGATTLYLNDGSGDLRVRVWDESDLDSVNIDGRYYRLGNELVGVECRVSGVAARDGDDFVLYAGHMEDIVGLSVVERRPKLPPAGFTLSQNYPNPFNLSTTISYTVPRVSPVTLSVYDVTGRLVEGRFLGVQTAGAHDYHFDAGALASGMYFVQIGQRAGGARTKIVVLR
ncbi:T9SS type A sorting domain-containing protein [candidate division KSB1 bacterium]|nr:T9SS type A sorting domain-containing protein [candidate division KSB1 bacterium]